MFRITLHPSYPTLPDFIAWKWDDHSDQTSDQTKAGELKNGGTREWFKWFLEGPVWQNLSSAEANPAADKTAKFARFKSVKLRYTFEESVVIWKEGSKIMVLHSTDMVDQASTDIVDQASNVLHPGIGSLPSIIGTSTQGFFSESVHRTDTGHAPYSRDGTTDDMSRDRNPSSTEPYLYTYSYSVNANRGLSTWSAQPIDGSFKWMDEFVVMK